jgi:hypothetical protein
MIPSRLKPAALAVAAATLMGTTCATLPRMPWLNPESPPVEAPSTIDAERGEGRLRVHGENDLNAPGHRVFRALRQEETLNAFLVCQGDPDYVEVKPAPEGQAPEIELTYSRRGLPQRGTVKIQWSESGYYVALPIKPEETPPAPPAPHPPPPPPGCPTEPWRRECRDLCTESAPWEWCSRLPTEEQLRRCPTEPWSRDCEDLCMENAPWEWCRYPIPTAKQREDCPVEPWSGECQDFCIENAPWEWCRYPIPTAKQRDDCPIEPWSRECQDFCTENAPWEWCSDTD